MRIFILLVAIVATGCKKDAAAGDPATGSATATVRTPPAKAAAITGSIPLPVLAKLNTASEASKPEPTAKRVAKPTKAKAAPKKQPGKQATKRAASRPKVARKHGGRAGKGMHVEAIPKRAAKQGKRVAKQATRPKDGRVVRAPIRADGTFALQVPAADYLLVFYDGFGEPRGTLGFPTGPGAKRSSILPFSRGPGRGRVSADMLQVNLGMINVDVESWTFLAELNPLELFDSDGDGENDFIDVDDDGDGTTDITDLDADGDGDDDTLFDFDADNDGQLDLFDLDDDNDGIVDTEDTDDDGDGQDDGATDEDGDGLDDAMEDAALDDDDGDGIDNDHDPDDDNDGTPDAQDADDDNDGVADDQEGIADSDHDGTPDDRDADDDNDGIPDAQDTDDDNDGIPDTADSQTDGLQDVETVEASHGQDDTPGQDDTGHDDTPGQNGTDQGVDPEPEHHDGAQADDN